MPTRDTAPSGAPCWVDLSTSDTARSRAFYTELFGWTAEEPNEQFGGYFNYRSDGRRVAGCMPAMPGSPTDMWSVYLATDDARKTLEAANANRGRVIAGPMDVGDLGTMAVLLDAGGATIGVWQAQTFPGFTVMGEPGTPTWFELQARDYDASVAFYRDVLRCDTQVMSDSPPFRYMCLTDGQTPLAGVMDASGSLPGATPGAWAVYFGCSDTDAALAKAVELGGTVTQPAEDSPYGRMATARDATGALFKLVQV